MSTLRNSRGIDLVIFDCDGVLVDSEVIACRAVAETLQAIGHAIAPEAVAERFAGMSNKDMYAHLARELGTLPAEFDAEMNRRAAAIFARELKAMAGVEAVLARPGGPHLRRQQQHARASWRTSSNGRASRDGSPVSSSAPPRSRAASPRRTFSFTWPSAWASCRRVHW